MPVGLGVCRAELEVTEDSEYGVLDEVGDKDIAIDTSGS